MVVSLGLHTNWGTEDPVTPSPTTASEGGVGEEIRPTQLAPHYNKTEGGDTFIVA